MCSTDCGGHPSARAPGTCARVRVTADARWHRRSRRHRRHHHGAQHVRPDPCATSATLAQTVPASPIGELLRQTRLGVPTGKAPPASLSDDLEPGVTPLTRRTPGGKEEGGARRQQESSSSCRYTRAGATAANRTPRRRAEARSASVVPPQIPATGPFAVAQVRQGSTAGHRRQTALASFIW